jgi:hypothetical protein
MKYRDYKNLAGDVLLIGDCETAAFTNASDLSSRHRYVFARIDYAKAIVKSGEVKEEEKEVSKPITYTPPAPKATSDTPSYESESPSRKYETPSREYEPPKKREEPPGLNEKTTTPKNEPKDTTGSISDKKYETPSQEDITNTDMKSETSVQGYEYSGEKKPLSGKQGEKRE